MDRKGFVLWLRCLENGESHGDIASKLADLIGKNGVDVDLMDVEALAREAYRSGEGELAAMIAGKLVEAGERGVHTVVHGSRYPSSRLNWRKQKPERLLDVVAGDPDVEDAHCDALVPQLQLRKTDEGWDFEATGKALKQSGWLD